MGQIGKGVEFKSLLKTYIYFVHMFSAEPVERMWEEFSSQNSNSPTGYISADQGLSST